MHESKVPDLAASAACPRSGGLPGGFTAGSAASYGSLPASAQYLSDKGDGAAERQPLLAGGGAARASASARETPGPRQRERGAPKGIPSCLWDRGEVRIRVSPPGPFLQCRAVPGVSRALAEAR